MGESMIIVGSGIAGLSAAYYAQMNGYKTSILEMHSIPGGLCTAWKRKGYTFDLSMHMLMGSQSGPLYRMWQELGVLEKQSFHYHHETAHIEGLEKSLCLNTNPKKLLEQLIRLSPEDAKLSQEFVAFLNGRDMIDALSLKPSEISGIGDKIKSFIRILPMLGNILKHGKKTLQDYLQGYKDDFLREALRFLMDAPDWPMPQFPLIAMAGMMNSAVTEAGVPLGGSQKVVFGIAKRYKEMGGEIHFNRKVKDLIIDTSFSKDSKLERVIGVRTEDGQEWYGENIVWAGDGHSLLFDILKGKYLNERLREMYEHWIPVQPLVHVSLGINKDLSDQPHRIIWELENEIEIAGQKRRWLSLRHRCFDPYMAPPGKSAAEVWYPTSYGYWEKLFQDREKYEKEKERIADITLSELEKRWPGLRSDVELADVSTPMTYVRYTGNWQGSPDGWYITMANLMKQTPVRSLEKLAGLYMVGQWTAPFTGTVIAALSGRQLIELLQKRKRTQFITGIGN